MDTSAISKVAIAWGDPELPCRPGPQKALRKHLPDSLVLLKGPEATSPGTQEPPVKCTLADGADPDLSMVVLKRHIGNLDGSLGGEHTSYLLIPFSVLRAQAHRASTTRKDSESARTDPDGGEEPWTTMSQLPVQAAVPWKDWGPRACLHLRLPVRPEGTIPCLPFSSRLPLVVSDSTNLDRASIFVFDINPLAARHAKRILAERGRDHGRNSEGTAIVAPEDLEGVLPRGAVDPECSAIQYVVYRFALPCSPTPTEGPARNGRAIRMVRMNMTGFTITLDGVKLEEREQTWAI
ncbi:hypothetical protein GSI_02766 [Ganoderma sinense ZZ0214-1]|uniref:Uncharacterized protein n=1 Tax=Ganoderma sinense ZZ0214-1 TaxID=1077348 RepID=A0A2G8SMK7_9APHY|nr:hypothetical protein GSI_02766 [Ganoderma sinense ZZ0214-1]